MTSNLRPLKVLVACEYSGTVRNSFLDQGFDAWSCDLLPSEDRSNRHIQGDVMDILYDDWDLLMVAHPPCTRLCNSGVRWLSVPPKGRTLDDMWEELRLGAELFSKLLNAPIPHIAIENPVMHRHAKEAIDGYVEFSQSVQPWQFGTEVGGPDDEKKRTCLWLKNLPNLEPLNILDGSTAGTRVHSAPPGPDRWKERSRFFKGIADAMAKQWGDYAVTQKMIREMEMEFAA